MNYRYILLIPILLLITNSLITNNCFSYGVVGISLELPGSARAGGMAECFTALSDEPLGVYYNPAGIAFVSGIKSSFVHQIYVNDLTAEYVGITVSTGNVTIGIAPAYVYMKEEPVFDQLGQDTGEKFGYKSFIVPVTIAYRSGNVSLGGTLKYYSDQIDSSYSNNVLTADVGAIYCKDKLRLGISAVNLIGTIDGFSLPKNVKIGAATAIDDKILVAAEYDKSLVLKDDTGNISFGGEFILGKGLCLRAGGMKPGYGTQIRPYFGLGIKWDEINIDYAYSNYDKWGATHRAGISFAFSTQKPVTKSLIEKPTVQINVAITDFVAKGVSAADATTISDFVRTDLVNIGYYKVTDRANMELILAEQKFQLSGCTDQECAVKIGKLLNVQQMVVGTVSKLVNAYYITVSVIDVETGILIKSDREKAELADDLPAACRKLAERISGIKEP